MRSGESSDKEQITGPCHEEQLERAEISIVGGSQYGGYMSLAESPEPLSGAFAGATAGATAGAFAGAAGGARSGPSPDGLAAGTAAAARIPANHLMDSVLPVRTALVDRGSAARTKP